MQIGEPQRIEWYDPRIIPFEIPVQEPEEEPIPIELPEREPAEKPLER